MSQSIHCFTSITSNYLPKARVLAASVKRVDPKAQFHLMLSDDPPAGFDLAAEPFDTVLQIENLPIPERKTWVFRHTVVEMCTAVKGVASLEIARRFQAGKVFYFDPDMAVFGGLDVLSTELDRYNVILTPHQIDPEPTVEGILDNEISSLKHGVYNLGFLGVNTASAEGLRFLEWWAQRLLKFCYDDIVGGLFTDQRWVDLAPAFFDGIGILREPQYNVATWNLSNRVATGSLAEGLRINGRPLSFYHFSGFDSGAQEVMLKKYGSASPVLFELREWYIAECRRLGQEALGKLPCKYGFFDNGEPITKAQRLLYRNREDLQRAFPDPFATADTETSYYHWYLGNAPAADNFDALPEAMLRSRLIEALSELQLIKGSRSWRLARTLAKVVNAFR